MSERLFTRPFSDIVMKIEDAAAREIAKIVGSPAYQARQMQRIADAIAGSLGDCAPKEEAMAKELAKQLATLKEICAEAEAAAVRNMVRAIGLLVDAGPSPDAHVIQAARLHLLAAGFFTVVAGSGAKEPSPNSGIPNSEVGKWVM